MNRIVYVPGKNPKPHPREHESQLWRCLLAGVQHADHEVAEQLRQHKEALHLVSWNHRYYGRYKSIEEDLPWIDTLLEKSGPSELDKREAAHWHKKTARVLYTLGDYFHFLINLIPDPGVKASIKETEHYFFNLKECADSVRELLKEPLRQMFSAGDRILLIGHSMGSIIAWDSLWELWHGEENPGRVEMFLTLGSPLGMHYVRDRLLGARAGPEHRYPGNIKQWINIASVGDLAALDRGVRNDYRDMETLGLVDSIRDEYKDVYNWFRNERGLNVHRSYGYLANPDVGKSIAEWWRQS
jgi:pimeloyl-ACP methyl ester carboxylesterase